MCLHHNTNKTKPLRAWWAPLIQLGTGLMRAWCLLTHHLMCPSRGHRATCKAFNTYFQIAIWMEMRLRGNIFGPRGRASLCVIWQSVFTFRYRHCWVHNIILITTILAKGYSEYGAVMVSVGSSNQMVVICVSCAINLHFYAIHLFVVNADTNHLLSYHRPHIVLARQRFGIKKKKMHTHN